VELTSIPDSGGTCLQIRGTLTIAELDPMRDAVLEALNRSPTLLLDLSGVEECDAAGLQLLYSACKNPGLRIQTLPSPVLETAAALGLSTANLTSKATPDAI
jgi:anti-anti-sigma regulatory factor